MTLSNTAIEQNRDLKRELKILSKINHPSIVRFVGFSPVNFHNESKPVIFTEYIRNGSLFEILDQENKSNANKDWDDTKKFICIYGIASAMKYLHDHNIIHRDLKAANILLDENLFPKIADFGFSKRIHQNQNSMSINSTSEVKGTPIYIAPEIYEANYYSQACDVFAFGYIVYEIMMCGENPWKNLDCYQIREKVLSGDRPEIEFHVPESYQNLIIKCWNQNPNKRPTFDEIIEILTNDEEGFITDLVDKEDFKNYITYIEDCKNTFCEDSIQFSKYLQQSASSSSIQNTQINPKSTQDSQIQRSIKTAPNSPSKVDKRSIFIHHHHNDKLIYPLESFYELDPAIQTIVLESCGNKEKEFKICQCLIEGKENFPRNAEIGYLYLEHLYKRSISAAIYYCRLLIKGDVFFRDIKKADRILKRYEKDKKTFKENKGTILCIKGKILKKQGQLEEAFACFEGFYRVGCAEGMYEYAKMLFEGKGCKDDQPEAKRIFSKSYNNGFKKVANTPILKSITD